MPPKPTDRLDELEEAWVPERPTAEKLKRIENSGPPESYPPPSTRRLLRDLRAWAKANALLIGLFVGTGGGGAVLPWRDWLGLATKAELQAEAKRNDDARRAQAEASQKELKRAREAGGKALQRVDDLESQLVAQKVLVESLGRRRPR